MKEESKKTSKLYSLFFIPIVFVFLFEIVFLKIDDERFINFLENLIFASLLISPYIIFGKSIISIIYLKLMYFFVLLFLFLETSYFYLYNTKFISSAIYIISQTNFGEAKEFLHFYIDIKEGDTPYDSSNR